jgi:hypothetical protein
MSLQVETYLIWMLIWTDASHCKASQHYWRAVHPLLWTLMQCAKDCTCFQLQKCFCCWRFLHPGWAPLFCEARHRVLLLYIFNTCTNVQLCTFFNLHTLFACIWWTKKNISCMNVHCAQCALRHYHDAVKQSRLNQYTLPIWVVCCTLIRAHKHYMRTCTGSLPCSCSLTFWVSSASCTRAVWRGWFGSLHLSDSRPWSAGADATGTHCCEPA